MIELNKDTDLLVICSSKSRSHRICDMVNSFMDTKWGRTELIIYVSNDDPELEDYKKNLLSIPLCVKLMIDKPRTMVEVINYLSTELFPDVKYYAEVNDDHVYITPGWDVMLMQTIIDKNGWAIAYGKMTNFPSAIMISNKIVKALGYFFSPVFNHGFVDNVVMTIGKAIGTILCEVPKVIIEHRHPSWGSAQSDSTYEAVNKNIAQNGLNQYNEWKLKYRDNDILRLKNAIIYDISKNKENANNA